MQGTGFRSPFRRLRSIGARQFAAQMNEMLGTQMSGILRGIDRARQRAGMLRREIARLEGAGPQRVEHGGDAGGRDLRVMRHHGGHCGPRHARARVIMAFEMISVELHKAGNEIVAVEILVSGMGRPDRDIVHECAPDGDRSCDHLFGQNDLGIAEDDLCHDG